MLHFSEALAPGLLPTLPNLVIVLPIPEVGFPPLNPFLPRPLPPSPTRSTLFVQRLCIIRFVHMLIRSGAYAPRLLSPLHNLIIVLPIPEVGSPLLNPSYCSPPPPSPTRAYLNA